MAAITIAQLACMTLDTAILRRDQGLITMPQYRAFLYVWHCDPTKTEARPRETRPLGTAEQPIIDALLAITELDEFAKYRQWESEGWLAEHSRTVVAEHVLNG